MVKGLGNNGVVIVEGECGEEKLQVLKGGWQKSFESWRVEGGKGKATNMAFAFQQTCTLALEVYKKDWQNALVDDTFSNSIGVEELCQFFIL
jgi:hypothetical protein